MKRSKKVSLLVRIIVPFLVLVAWLGLSGVGGPYFGRIDEVSSNDMTTFLPSSAESTKVNNELSKFRDSSAIPAIVVFESKDTLSEQQRKSIDASVERIKQTGVVRGEVSPALLSEDKKASFVVVPLDSKAEVAEEVTKLRDAVKNDQAGMEIKLTGPAVYTQDLMKAFSGIDGLLLLAALSVVFIILLVVYRSPILPIVTLMGSIFALSTAILIVWHLAKAGVVQLNGQVQGILFILVIGAATDYALLYISRYREELVRQKDAWHATLATWKASWEPIVAAGGTVTLGLLCLLVSDLGSNRALGPVGGVGIVCAVLSALTFLPAALLLLGTRAFWPRVPRKSHHGEDHAVWAKIGRLVQRHPRRLWMGCCAVLLVASFGILQLKADGVAQSAFVLGASEARDGQAVLDAHFPAGSGSPATVLVPVDRQQAVVAILEKDKGIDGVNAVSSDPSNPTLPVGAAAAKLEASLRDSIAATRTEQVNMITGTITQRMAGAPQTVIDQAITQATHAIPSVESIVASANPFKDVRAKEVDGMVLLQATLKYPADSLEARQTIERVRTAVHAEYPDVRIGGISAVQLDTNSAAERDLRIIIPLILVVITVVLMLLLRAIVAPLILLATTVLSFAATLGISALLFNHGWQYPGADPSVVIYGFVFLVALGIDYNIFLMTRVREETAARGVQKGTIHALVVTGGVISSAGIVLASTFAALYVIPILFLAQLAFIVACGVLIDTLIVRSLIVPGITLDVGRVMWWPSKLWTRKK